MSDQTVNIDDLFSGNDSGSALASVTIYVPTDSLRTIFKRAVRALGVDSKKHPAYDLAAKASAESQAGQCGASMSALVTLVTLAKDREESDSDPFGAIFARLSTEEENEGSGRPSTALPAGSDGKSLIRVGQING